MPMSAIELYMGKLEKNRAIWRMMLGEAAKLPHLDDEDRRSWANDIEELINDGKRIERIAPPAMLNMIGIGIRK